MTSASPVIGIRDVDFVSAPPSAFLPRALRPDRGKKRPAAVQVPSRAETALLGGTISQLLRQYLKSEGYEIGDEIGRGSFGYVCQLKRGERSDEVIKFLINPTEVKENHGEHLAPKTPSVVKMRCLFYYPNRDQPISKDRSDGAIIAGIIMPFEIGKDLEKEIATLQQENRKMEDKQLLKIIQGIAVGLQDLNKEKIEHRDIRPANVIIREDGSVVLMDLGTAKRYVMEGDETPVGTELYMPAERRARGGEFKPQFGKSDVYSLGRVFMRLLGVKLTSDYWEEFRALDFPEIPAEFQKLLQGMLARNPQERWTIDEVISAVGALLIGQEQ